MINYTTSRATTIQILQENMGPIFDTLSENVIEDLVEAFADQYENYANSIND